MSYNSDIPTVKIWTENLITHYVVYFSINGNTRNIAYENSTSHGILNALDVIKNFIKKETEK